MKKYDRIIRLVSEHPWAILPATLDVIVEVLALRAEGVMFTDEEIRARLGPAPRAQGPASQLQGTVAVVPLFGVIAPRVNVMTQLSGGTSADVFGSVLRRVVGNPEVSAVVIDVDSPGGSVFGIEEAAATIRGLRGSKPLVAVVNHMAASAAYWLVSQADEVIVSPSGMVGSIGVIAAHTDLTAAAAKAGVKTTYVTAGKFKHESAPGEALTDEARADMQAKVDEFYRVFTRDVARGRGVTPRAVREGFGEGRLVQAREAVKLGMADGVGTLEAVVARLAEGGRTAVAGGPRSHARPLIGAPMIEPNDDGTCPPGYHPVETDDGPMCEPDAQAQVEPDEQGDCPEGYEKGGDGMCHRVDPEARQRQAIQREATSLRQRLAALGA